MQLDRLDHLVLTVSRIREQLGYDQDEHFAFIVGYTSGGFPYGLTWEEWAEIAESVDDDEEQDEVDSKM
jgi:hypothetical protein